MSLNLPILGRFSEQVAAGRMGAGQPVASEGET